MTKWKTASHVVSWMGLSPNIKISGGKVLSSKTIKTCNEAKQALRLAAWGLSNSKNGLAAHCRRLRARIGAPKAINATARKIAVIFYNMLKNSKRLLADVLPLFDRLCFFNIPRQQRFNFFHRFSVRQSSKNLFDIVIRLQSIGFCCFYQTVMCCTGTRTRRCV